MIVLDTNVLSELMATSPAPQVVDWVNAQETSHLCLTTVTIAEIGYGLRILPDGRRRRLLESRFEQFLELAFSQRILSFDPPAARAYGEVMALRREMGRPLNVPDGQIAAIAHSRKFAVATRNLRDFEALGLTLINPFATTI
ncbi:MAG: type II toxin-antitoxin system VapC family toxin [Candidatus Competibacteraceae bacterium]|nr:type II toxin-antitoxin system VapC family toxin [Candidatus Competibacteraceae bacterium]